MKQIVELQIRNKYGRDLIYPVSPNAHVLAEMVGKKTFSMPDVKLIEKLGFKIEWVPPSVNFKALQDE